MPKTMQQTANSAGPDQHAAMNDFLGVRRMLGTRQAEESHAVDLTKQVAANADVSANMALAVGIKLRNTPLSKPPACSAVWKISHSETKPFSGGKAEILKARPKK